MSTPTKISTSDLRAGVVSSGAGVAGNFVVLGEDGKLPGLDASNVTGVATQAVIDTAVAAEATARDGAISTAVAAEATARDTAIGAAVAGIPAGAAGAAGTNGTNGADGAAGTNGTNGTDGTNGTNGTDGAKGDKGDKGDTGAAGADGADPTAAIAAAIAAEVTARDAAILVETTARDAAILVETTRAEAAEALLTLISSFVDGEIITGDDSTTLFTLANTFIAGSLHVFRNGLRLRGGGVDYSETGTTQITFVAAPGAADNTLVDYRK